MILTGSQIRDEVKWGNIVISDFDLSRLNPNSYNLRLADEIGTYLPIPIEFKAFDECSFEEKKNILNKHRHKMPPDGDYFPTKYGLDMKKKMPLHIQKIPEEGFILEPGQLYLARTMEYTETMGYIPMLEGRSSIGRLGISIHATAGFGDIGFCGYWTLEISCVQPVKIYPGVEIAQIFYLTQNDPTWRQWLYGVNGKYQNNNGIQPSMLWKEFEMKKIGREQNENGKAES